ncbi:folylpolyglutamate synthase/dihydrofolate synthase family protein [Thermoflexus sp.]|uniref:bifunctional folylpolyglutamate synthase/dihydrofolate synthase n=1 Tax=Thermoflexus sp. TaxID=1969742 RepID=UPI002ADDD6DE|nr:folylpolyglutamate synthase/dihydrofolate synthase family protein [Thermoflexus sp.]
MGEAREESAYLAALFGLFGRANFETRRPQMPEAFRLDPVRRLLERLGNPHRRYAVIHIAGTKGKGSTAAMAEAILRAAGYRTGLYTSPHLHTMRERIRIAGEMLSRSAVADLFQRLRPLIEADPELTVFDLLTAMGFLAFAESGVEIAVVEVGLGGRLDSTNVVSPAVCLITALSRDHTEILGPTLAHIAFEKAGILKPGVPAVTAPQPEEAMAVLRQVAEERDVPLFTLDGWRYGPEKISPAGQWGEIRAPDGARWSVRLPLLGRHQWENAALAVAAMLQLREQGWGIPDEAIREGLEQVKWPGRFEILREDPPLVLDGAHNDASAARLAETIAEVFPGHRWRLIFGVSADKDPITILRPLWPLVEKVWLTRSRHPRAADPQRLAEAAEGLGLSWRIRGEVAQALEEAFAEGGPILVTGSLFVVAEAREAWAAWGRMPVPEIDPILVRVGGR